MDARARRLERVMGKKGHVFFERAREPERCYTHAIACAERSGRSRSLTNSVARDRTRSAAGRAHTPTGQGLHHFIPAGRPRLAVSASNEGVACVPGQHKVRRRP